MGEEGYEQLVRVPAGRSSTDSSLSHHFSRRPSAMLPRDGTFTSFSSPALGSSVTQYISVTIMLKKKKRLEEAASGTSSSTFHIFLALWSLNGSSGEAMKDGWIPSKSRSFSAERPFQCSTVVIFSTRTNHAKYKSVYIKSSCTGKFVIKLPRAAWVTFAYHQKVKTLSRSSK